jgi:hypothetical protein
MEGNCFRSTLEGGRRGSEAAQKVGLWTSQAIPEPQPSFFQHAAQSGRPGGEAQAGRTQRGPAPELQFPEFRANAEGKRQRCQEKRERAEVAAGALLSVVCFAPVGSPEQPSQPPWCGWHESAPPSCGRVWGGM